MKSYSKDPRWTVAQYDLKCTCGADVKQGEDIFFYPIKSRVKGSKCGCANEAYNDFRNCNGEAY